jgi:chromosome segregation ATPase
MPENTTEDLTVSGASGSGTVESGHRAVPRLSAGAVETASAGESEALRILLQASAAAESLQQRFSELQQRRAEIVADQQQLEADRRAFEQRAQEFAAQVARDRSDQREMRADLEQRLSKVAQHEELLQRQAGELRSAQRALAEERVILKQSVRAELDEDRMKISQERAFIDAERDRLKVQAERDREDYAEKVKQLADELRLERQRLSERAKEELAAEIAQLNRQKDEWKQAHEQQVQEIQQQADDLQRQREMFGEQVDAEQQRLREEIEKKRQSLLTEQNNLQRRYRFQFEHLTRAKEDLEVELREFRREQQLFRSERLRFLEQHRLRFRQLERLRQLLMDRESSLGRELRIIERSRTAALSDIQRQQRRSEEERDAILRDIESRQRRIRQQEAAMADLAARLDDRSQRLNRLRSELDQTQAEILEHRLVIEEARTNLLRDTPTPEVARARLEQAKGDVQSFFERLRAQINADRDKVEAAANDIAERQQQFRRDRAELEQWFAAKEEELQSRAAGSVVDEQQEFIQALQAQMNHLQDRWQRERLEAENTIRDLLTQLTARELGDMNSPNQKDGPSAGSTRDAA